MNGNAARLRELGFQLRQALTCPQCGGSMMLEAAHRTAAGHRTGLQATEEPSPQKHCTCPGGPCWPTLKGSQFGKAFRLAEGEDEFDAPNNAIACYDYQNEQWIAINPASFRDMVLAWWKKKAE